MTEQHPLFTEAEPGKPLLPVALVLILILVFYGFLLSQNLPQEWTKMSHFRAEVHDIEIHPPPYFMVVPFVTLLFCIAILPLIPVAAHWWERNTNKLLIATGLGIVTLLYYSFGGNVSVERHGPYHAMIDSATHGSFAVAQTVFMNAVVFEFFPFIVLLFSLVIITGGIRIAGNLKATPFANTVILFFGTVLASFIGTTGAAMLLIRLLLDTNRKRRYKVHTIVIFIFCVCNCGGCLTPIGDPPLFLGYLRGVAFEWTFFALWREWALINLTLITFYFLWDSLWFYRRENHYESREHNNVEQPDQPAQQSGYSAVLRSRLSFAISGWMLNVPLLLGVVAAVAFLDPGKTLPGTDWHPWYYLREAVQLGLAAISLLCSSNVIRKANAFNFSAIGEVAVLFFGIFICMQVPLQILNVKGTQIVTSAEKVTGLEKEKLFFWATGSLSSVLDNAPTYVVFFETARALTPKTDETKERWRAENGRAFQAVPIRGGAVDHHLLIAVSLGAVFMGAMTYIGNGPNFMVKAIAEQDGIEMPSFFGYMVYSCLILLPLFVVMTMAI